MRRAALGLTAFSLVIGVGCRPKIEPVETPGRSAAEAAPGVEVCWIESRGKLGFTASALLVHPVQRVPLSERPLRAERPQSHEFGRF